MGNIQAAEELKKEFPSQFPTQVIYDTAPEITNPTSSITSITQTLLITIPRMVNDEIKFLQEFLNGKGYEPLVVDGVFGKNTKETVILLQKDHNLVTDGIVGPKTRVVINSME